MDAPETKKRIMILGGGFGGVYTARHLEKLLRGRTDVEIVLVSQHNFVLMTPLLFEVAKAGDEVARVGNNRKACTRLLLHERIVVVERDDDLADMSCVRHAPKPIGDLRDRNRRHRHQLELSAPQFRQHGSDLGAQQVGLLGSQFGEIDRVKCGVVAHGEEAERGIGVDVALVKTIIVQPKQNPKASLCEDRVCRLEVNVKTQDVCGT